MGWPRLPLATPGSASDDDDDDGASSFVGVILGNKLNHQIIIT